MIIRQMSVFLENRPGAMAEVLAVLKDHRVNLRALALADTSDFGILRLIVNEPDKIGCILRDAGFTVKITQVLALTLEDDPGSLYEKLMKFSGAGVNVEYMYAFAAAGDSFARVVLKVDNLELAAKIANGQEPSAESGTEEEPSFYW
mgnify:FL=1